MSPPTDAAPLGPSVERGKIYRDVYAKRQDDEVVVEAAALERAWTEDGELRFADAAARARAFADGVFALRRPASLRVAAGDQFAEQFFRGPGAEPYGRFRDLRTEAFGDPLLGFHQRINQIEQFLLERRFWRSHYPPEIAHLGEQLTELSQQILRAVLSHLQVPPAQWSLATGGCSERAGSYHLTFNHYRPSAPGCGLASHKDDGFLTILRTTTPGLEVNRRDRWERVPIDPDYFIVNFGLSMELLTSASPTPIAAIMHRVAHQVADRTSFGHFTSSCCLPGADGGIYRFTPEDGLTRICSSRELIDNNDHEIYQGTDRPEEEDPR
ncbi:MAG: 2OG-Fe(II) oxygenase family protein [Kofleriaceae bacterium]